MSRFHFWSGLAAGAFLLFDPAPVGAAEPVHLDYRATGDCPNEQAFIQAVSVRTPQLRRAAPGEWARPFRIRVESETAGEARGDFSIGDSEHRSVSGGTCSEVIEALALFVALSVDPDATDAPRADATQSTRVVNAPPRDPMHPRIAAPAPARPRWRGLIGGHVGIMSVGTPNKAVLLEPFAELGLYYGAPVRGPRFAPALRLAFSHSKTETTHTPEGFAELTWTTMRVDVCPLEVRLSARAAARPCFSGSGGQFHPRGRELDRSNEYRLGWWTVGGLLRLEWNAISVLNLEADAGFDAPLARSHLIIEPETRLFETPLALGRLRLGLSVQFP